MFQLFIKIRKFKMTTTTKDKEFKAKVLSQSIFLSKMQINTAKSELAAELSQQQKLLENASDNAQKIKRHQHVINDAERRLRDLEAKLEAQQERLDELKENTAQKFAKKLYELKSLIKNPEKNVFLKMWDEKLTVIKNDSVARASQELLQEIDQAIAGAKTTNANIELLEAGEKEIIIIKEKISKAKNGIGSIRASLSGQEGYDWENVTKQLPELKSFIRDLDGVALKTVESRQIASIGQKEALKKFKAALEDQHLSEDKIMGQAVALGLNWPEDAAFKGDAASLKTVLKQCTEDAIVKYRALENDSKRVNEKLVEIDKALDGVEKGVTGKEIQKAYASTIKRLNDLHDKLSELESRIDSYLNKCNVMVRFVRKFGKTARILKSTHAMIMQAMGEVESEAIDVNDDFTKKTKIKNIDKHDVLSGARLMRDLVEEDFAKSKDKEIIKIDRAVKGLLK